MSAARSVAGLAANTDLGKLVKCVVSRTVVFVHTRRVAIRAHVIPVLSATTPMLDHRMLKTCGFK
ncbi:MAG: hypothetical protein CM15mP120_29210 [Pseudomonadota bacterium]|nr:MAG: hypothetical protein CM15mP120_29210 [Pseudomonadota bacterium]